MLGVENRNNVGPAPKLRLFRFQDGKSLCENGLDSVMKALLQNEDLFNGDSVILEYIENEQLAETVSVDSKLYSTKK